MSVNFLPKTKGFFPHDYTLIASVVGESVIGHGIGGKHIPIMARLAKARRYGLVCHHPILRPLKVVMAIRSKYVDATYHVRILRHST